jgi:lysyl-tRNA synthetase class 2
MDDARLKALRLRARLYALIRAFFAERAVLELDTPVLGQGASTDANIDSFDTGFGGPAGGGGRRRFLRTSPEFWHKRLLVEGIGDCYELGKVFRDGEFGRRHNPEFTLLEWYRTGWDLPRLMAEVESLVRTAFAFAGRSAGTAERISYRELFRRHLATDPLTAPDDELRRLAAGVWVDAGRLDRDGLLDVLVSHRIEPALPPHGLTFVHDYPASQAALARVRKDSDGERIAERFELYVGQLELANGFNELADPMEQLGRFEADNRLRVARGGEPLPIDGRFLAALEQGLPACAGVALGVDRLLMAMLEVDDIREVLAFSFPDA